MTKPTPIHIFRAGRHTDSGGHVIDFSADDVRRTATTYDPALHEAPLVIGHPRSDAPAYGWVQKLNYSDGDLSAVPHQLAPEFVEWVRAGRLKKVSASFYQPEDERNPAPGTYYLRHVGFLGAQPPALKGLRPVDLSDGDRCINIEFADLPAAAFGEADGSMVRDIFRRLREWLIGSVGQEVADQVVPNWAVDLVDVPEDAEVPQEAVHGQNFSETQTEGSAMPEHNEAEVADRIKVLEERERALQAREAQFAESVRMVRQSGREKAVDALVDAGKIIPADKAGVMLLFGELDGATLDFAEGKQPACDWLLGYLGRQPVRIDYSERSAPRGENLDATAPTAGMPRGATYSPERIELHRKALAYAEKHEVDYLAAVLAVEKHQ